MRNERGTQVGASRRMPPLPERACLISAGLTFSGFSTAGVREKDLAFARALGRGLGLMRFLAMRHALLEWFSAPRREECERARAALWRAYSPSRPGSQGATSTNLALCPSLKRARLDTRAG